MFRTSITTGTHVEVYVASTTLVLDLKYVLATITANNAEVAVVCIIEQFVAQERETVKTFLSILIPFDPEKFVGESPTEVAIPSKFFCK